jgi:putative membrane protein
VGNAPGALPGWHLHPEVWVVFAALAAGYWWALRHAPDGTVPATRRQRRLFGAGLAVLLVGSAWPVHDLAEDYLFSVHMVQHTLFSLVAPPLLLAGIPAWLAERALRPGWLRALVYRATRPIPAFIAFNTVVVVTHWPPLVDASLRSEPLHFGVHLVLFTTAAVMWTPVVSPAPKLLPRLSPPTQMLYLFLQSVIPTVPASFLTLGDEPIYGFYVEAPRMWGLSALDDQLWAGLIMKLGAGFLLWGIIAVVFFRWYAAEERKERGVLLWSDVEEELQRLP